MITKKQIIEARGKLMEERTNLTQEGNDKVIEKDEETSDQNKQTEDEQHAKEPKDNEEKEDVEYTEENVDSEHAIDEIEEENSDEEEELLEKEIVEEKQKNRKASLKIKQGRTKKAKNNEKKTEFRKKEKIATPGKQHKGPPFIVTLENWQSDKKTHPYTNKTKIMDLMNRLKEEAKRKMREGCFKDIIELGIINFPPKLMQHLIGKIVYNTNPDVLSFNFDGRIETFSIKEFCVITGLHCTEESYTNISTLPESTIMRTLFDDAEMSEKMARLCVLESILRPMQKTTNVKTLHLRLVEDEEKFSIYPWGRKSYNITLASIKKVMESPETNFHALDGFPHALILWAYEVLPALSRDNVYATRIDTTTPRILNWYSSKQGTWKAYEKNVFSNPIEVHKFITTKDEFESDHLKPLLKEMRQKSRKTNVFKEEETNKDAAREIEELKLAVNVLIEQNHILKTSMFSVNKKCDKLKTWVEAHLGVKFEWIEKELNEHAPEESDKCEGHDQTIRNEEIENALKGEANEEIQKDEGKNKVEEENMEDMNKDSEDEIIEPLIRKNSKKRKEIEGMESSNLKKEEAVGKKKAKKNQTRVMTTRARSLRPRIKSRSTKDPYTEDFGSKEKSITLTQELKRDSPTFHILTQE